MDFQLVYITTSSRAEAQKIGRKLVEQRLAACANIIDNMNSIYWWDNEIQEDQETILILKTKASLVESLVDTVKSLHSYDVPCVVTFPIIKGNKEFLSHQVSF